VGRVVPRPMRLRQEVWDHGLQRCVTPAAWDEWENDAEKDQVAPEVSSEGPDSSSDARAD
jgi:hypothetical protein